MIGALNQRATIKAQTFVSDGGGGFDDGWSTIATAWVRIEPRSGTQTFGADRNEQQVRHRLTLRRNEDIVAGQRVNVGARWFAIESVLDEGPQAQTMTLLCEEIP
ncbi:MAG TPA: phage head closure protein [Rhizomicrobium sp.]|jgi:SPP1 family predicted phage head-tail adaptor|nr:phage head closure protein [Rhizomicrobium sp.]